MENKKKLITDVCIIILYALFTLFVVLRHEYWVDEVQVWLIVKNLSLPELFRHLSNEAHPSLFYLMVMPFAKLNLGIISMQIICWLFSCFGVWLILRYSPFKWWCKLSIILSAGFLYFFPVIARSYSVLPFLIFTAAILYEKRKELPLLYSFVLFLISQVHVIMFAFISLLTLFFGYEIKKEKLINKKTISAFSIMCLGLLLVVLQLSNSIHSNIALQSNIKIEPITVLNVFVEFFANTINDISEMIIPALCIFLALLFIVLLVELFKKSKSMFALTVVSLGFQFGIYITVYPFLIYGTRIFTAYMILLFAYWVVLKNSPEGENNDKTVLNINILLTIFFAFSFYNGIKNCVMDIKYPYSGAKYMAEYIKKNVDKNNSVLFYVQPNITMALLYYLDGYDTIYAPYNERVKFVVWDDRINRAMRPDIWELYLRDYMENNKEEMKNKDIYIIQRQEIYVPINNTEVLYTSSGYKANWEHFVLSKYHPQNKIN